MSLLSIKIGTSLQNAGDPLPCKHIGFTISHNLVPNDILVTLRCSTCGLGWPVWSIIIEQGMGEKENGKN